MSGLVKSVKKVFQKVTKFVKEYWKVIVVAAAVYFTAGIALSYFGSTAGFAGSVMPGFGSGGMLSKAAVWMGFKGSAGVASGLSMTSGLWAGASGAAMGSTLTAAQVAGATAAKAGVLAPAKVTATKAVGNTLAGANVGGAGATAGAQASAIHGSLAASGFAGAAAPIAGAATGADAVIKAMSGAYKLQAASTLFSTAAGLLGDSEDKINNRQHARQNATSFGVGRDGSTEFGWDTTGGSDAFKNMSLPPAARYGEAPQMAGSSYAASANQDFLNTPYNQPSNTAASPYDNMGGAA